MPTWITVAAVAGLVLLYLISHYNRLVTLRHNVDQAWSNIDVLLKQRHEQIPALVEVCKRYMTHEAEVLSDVTRLRDQAETARASGDTASLSGREQALTASLSGLLARAEAYPDLKTAEAFQQLMARMSELYEALSDRRELYNDAVTINNRRQQQFPEMLLAGPFGFRPRALFEIDQAERANPDVNSLLSA